MEFKSHRGYFSFRHEVESKSRYIRSRESEIFLQALSASVKKRVKQIPQNSSLWRAQRGNCWQKVEHEGEMIDAYPRPFSDERMFPLTDRAREGRINPKGIAYLYTATNYNTAMAETRPWIGTYISVVQLATVRNLHIVNIAADSGEREILIDEPEPEVREQFVWADLNRAFSKPVSRSEDTADYAATQIIAELFRTDGYDGVGYSSALEEGYNIALFDPKVVKVVSRHVFEPTSINYRFSCQSDSSIMWVGDQINLAPDA